MQYAWIILIPTLYCSVHFTYFVHAVKFTADAQLTIANTSLLGARGAEQSDCGIYHMTTTTQASSPPPPIALMQNCYQMMLPIVVANSCSVIQCM